MSIRLIALDIDGTLVSRGQPISRENLNAIQRAQDAGVFVTIATGRGYQASKRIIDALNIDGPVITYGGAMISDAVSGKIISMETLLDSVIRKAFAFAKEVDVHIQLYQNDIVYAEKSCDFFEYYTGFHNGVGIIDPNIMDQTWENVPKLLAYEPDPSREEKIRSEFTKTLHGLASVSKTEPGYIEINCIGATKGSALKKIAEQMGITQLETAALGDSFLDISMLEWAGEGVAVGNALDPVKEISDRIVPAAHENGVAYYIEHFVL